LTSDVLDRGTREFLESTGAPFLKKRFDISEVRRLLQGVIALTDQATPK